MPVNTFSIFNLSNSAYKNQIFDFVTFREEKFYTLKPEEYVIKVEHSVIATKFFGNSDTESGMIAGSQRIMKGWLYDVDGSKIREYVILVFSISIELVYALLTSW